MSTAHEEREAFGLLDNAVEALFDATRDENSNPNDVPSMPCSSSASSVSTTTAPEPNTSNCSRAPAPNPPPPTR